MKIKNKATRILTPNINIVIPPSKRSQAWGIDLMIASVIFTVAIVFFYLYALNEPNEAQETIDALYYDGRIISDSILSEGYPKNWTASDVITIGILTNNKINETKLKNFNELAKTNEGYAFSKQKFNTRYEYYFNLSATIYIDGSPIPGIGMLPQDTKNLVKITRFSVYKNKPTTVHLYVFNK